MKLLNLLFHKNFNPQTFKLTGIRTYILYILKSIIIRFMLCCIISLGSIKILVPIENDCSIRVFQTFAMILDFASTRLISPVVAITRFI